MSSEESMEIRQLTALVAVADTGSVTAAARVLHVVQPAVTRQIRMLEAEVGATLFTRTRQGMVATAEGALLAEHARRALAELERGRLEIRPARCEVSGSVSVGLLESVADVLVPPLAASVAAAYPGIELRILTAYSGHLQQWLGAGDIDLSLLYNLPAATPFGVIPLLRERLWAVAPPAVGLSAATPVPWEQVLRQPLVLPVPGHGLRTLIEQAWSRLPERPQVAVQVNSMNLQKRLVLEGHGWTVLPAAGVAGDVASGQLCGAPLVAPAVERSVVLALPLGRRAPTPVEAVAAQLRRMARELVLSGAWPAILDPGLPPNAVSASAMGTPK
jgi:DNA-binding transcriptional LysR family regulator